MGQRHNRRRTRPRSRNRSDNLSHVEGFPLSTPLYASTGSSCFDCPGSPPASTRHYGWLTRQELGLTQRPEATKLEAEDQYRLFGGEPGDDVGLCYRMLEYFGGLDYIDPSQALTPLPG